MLGIFPLSARLDAVTMQHADIWRGVDLLAEKHGLSPSRLAKLAGLDATAFNKSKRISKDGRLRWPSTESLARALSAVGDEFSDFAALIDGAPGVSMPLMVVGTDPTPNQFDEHGFPLADDLETLLFPVRKMTDGAYVLEISEPSPHSEFQSGNRLIVSPRAQIRPGDRVILMRHNAGMEIGLLIRQTDSHITLSSEAKPSEPRVRPRADIAWMVRILWVSQ